MEIQRYIQHTTPGENYESYYIVLSWLISEFILQLENGTMGKEFACKILINQLNTENLKIGIRYFL